VVRGERDRTQQHLKSRCRYLPVVLTDQCATEQGGWIPHKGVNRTFVTAPAYWKFESTSLQQRVCELSVPERRGHLADWRTSARSSSPAMIVSTVGALTGIAADIGKGRLPFGHISRKPRRGLLKPLCVGPAVPGPR
jgi:hypothetical protein